MTNTLKVITITILSLGAASFAAVAPQNNAPRVYEEKGKELMKQAREKLKSYNTLKVDFSYVMENANQDIYEKMEGILYSQGESYRMQVGDNLFISDGVNVWAYMEEIDEVHITLAEDTDGALTPTSLLEEFESQFRATFIRQEQHAGKLVDIIDLIPNDPHTFFKYRIAIDARTKMPAYATAYDRHGGTYTYSINKYEPNISIPSGTFAFSPENHPGIEIIDLR